MGIDGTRCPRCGKEVQDVEDFFSDDPSDGKINWIECRKCGAIFSLTQHYVPYFVINQVSFADADGCGNVGCQDNSKKGGCEGEPRCTFPSLRHPCKDYGPTEGMITEYQVDTGKEYVAAIGPVQDQHLMGPDTIDQQVK